MLARQQAIGNLTKAKSLSTRIASKPSAKSQPPKRTTFDSIVVRLDCLESMIRDEFRAINRAVTVLYNDHVALNKSVSSLQRSVEKCLEELSDD